MSEEPGVEYLVPRVPHRSTIVLAEPDPAWPDRYRAQEAAIHRALGAVAALVAHVGSTSIPDLPAKPVIDVLLLVEDPAAEPAYVPPLEEVGFTFVLREPEWYEHRLLRGAEPAVNLHVFAVDSPEATRMLTFRDWLRTHEGERTLYAQTKRTLARQTWEHIQDYADAKSDVVEAILARATDRPTP